MSWGHVRGAHELAEFDPVIARRHEVALLACWAVLQAIAYRANHQTGRCSASHERLSQDCGGHVSARTVRRVIPALIEMGLVVEVDGRTGKGRPKVYQPTPFVHQGDPLDGVDENPTVTDQTVSDRSFGRCPKSGPTVTEETPTVTAQVADKPFNPKNPLPSSTEVKTPRPAEDDRFSKVINEVARRVAIGKGADNVAAYAARVEETIRAEHADDVAAAVALVDPKTGAVIPANAAVDIVAAKVAGQSSVIRSFYVTADQLAAGLAS